MKQNFQNKILSINNSGFGCLLTFVIGGFILGSIGLQWVVNGFLIFIALLILTPIIAIWGFSWWIKRNLIQDECPVCNYTFTGLKTAQFNCPNCGELLRVSHNKFIRETPDGTIEVSAIEISSNNILEEE